MSSVGVVHFKNNVIRQWSFLFSASILFHRENPACYCGSALWNSPGQRRCWSHRSRKRNCFSDRSVSFKKWGYCSLCCCCAFLYVKGTKHFSLNLFIYVYFATQQALFWSKRSTLRLYGEWNNCSIGAKVTDSAYEHSELFSSQAPLLFWILVSCCQSLFKKKHIGVEGGRGETGYFVQKNQVICIFCFSVRTLHQFTLL